MKQNMTFVTSVTFKIKVTALRIPGFSDVPKVKFGFWVITPTVLELST